MESMTLLWIMLATVGLGVALVAARLLGSCLQLMRMRFSPGAVARAERAAMPPDIAALLDPMRERLAALGFAYEETVLAEASLAFDGAQAIWMDIHLHAETGSRAAVHLAEAPEPGVMTAVSFTTDFEDATIETENRRLHLLLPVPTACQIADAAAATLAEHWAYHCRRLAVANLGTPIRDPDIIRERRLALRAEIFLHCVRVGLMREVRSGCYRLSARGAWRYLRQVLVGNRRVAALPPTAEIEDETARVLGDMHAWRAQEAMMPHLSMSAGTKRVWFLLSALGGAVAFGYMSAWSLAPILLGVLLVHEFGHALAMRAAGYRGLSVWVLPFLGAVAIGRKDDASPWQKLAVLLAGPLPGLIVATLCLRLSQQSPTPGGLLALIGWVALSFNLFNLLPFTPLDGGKILDTFLFARRPRWRFCFFALSTVALLAIAAMLDSIPLAGAAVLLAMGIPGSWRRMRLLSGLETGHTDEDNDHAARRIFARIHATPGPRWPAFGQRLQTVRQLLPWLRGRPPRALESVAGVLVYLAAIALPLAALWDTGMPRQLYAALIPAQVTHGEAPPDWEQQLAAAKSPEARWAVLWQAGQWFENAEDEDAARRYYRQALAESAALPNDERKPLRALDARLALARFEAPEAAHAVYREALPELRRLPRGERGRLADVLEALHWVDAKADTTTHIARFREAIAVRETESAAEDYRLFHDREQLARLLDAQGDAAAAEQLLRRNLAVVQSGGGRGHFWLLEPIAWFLIAHERAAEAEALLAAQPPPPFGGEQIASTLAWSRLVQGKTAAARATLADILRTAEKQRHNGMQTFFLVLDLIHASADAPEEQARWLAEADKLRVAQGTAQRGIAYLLNPDRPEAHWERSRVQARRAAYAQLPGADEELRAAEAANYRCESK